MTMSIHTEAKHISMSISMNMNTHAKGIQMYMTINIQENTAHMIMSIRVINRKGKTTLIKTS